MRSSKQIQIDEEARSIAAKEAEERKQDMEVEIEKIVNAQKEAQSAAEIADREEQTAHNKESRTMSSRSRARKKTSRKWKLNSRRCVISSLSWTRTSSHRPEGEPKAIDKERSRAHPF